MALTKLKLVKDDAPNGSTARTLLLQHNLVANYLRALTVKLDADVGVTDTDYTTTLEATSVRLLSSAGGDVEVTA